MSNEPKLKLRDGLITATVWENTINTDDGEKTRLSIDVVRNFKDKDGNWNETSSFSPTELLKVSRLADRAYDSILEQRQAEKA